MVLRSSYYEFIPSEQRNAYKCTGVKNVNTYKTVIEVLNKCDLAYLNGDALNWFYDEDGEVITFDYVNGSIGFDANNIQPFNLTDNELEIFTTDEETVYLDLCCITKPTF